MRYNHLVRPVEVTDDEVKLFKSARFGAMLRHSRLEILPYVRDPLFLVQLIPQLVIYVTFCLFGFYSCGFLLTNLTLLLKLLQVLSLQVLMFVVALLTNVYPERIEKLHRYMATPDFVDYGNVMIPIRKQLEKFAEKNQRAKIYPVLIVTAVSSVVPFISTYVEQLLSSEPASPYYNGINIVLPIPLYFSLPSHEGLWYFVCLLFELVSIASSFSIGIMTSLVILLTMQKIMFELKMLSRSVEMIHERAEALSRDNPTTDFEECLHVCLQQNIIHYKIIKQARADLQTAYGVMLTLAIAFVTGMTILGLTALSNFFVKGQLAKGVMPLCFLCTPTASAFLVNLFGEDIATENDNLFNTLYSIKWIDYPEKFKKTFLIFKEFVKQPMIVYFTIWPLSLDTFATVMLRGSFSYFNMLNTISQSPKFENDA